MTTAVWLRRSTWSHSVRVSGDSVSTHIPLPRGPEPAGPWRRACGSNRTGPPRRRAVTMVHSVLREAEVETHHPSRKITYADLLRLPEDGLRHELVDGAHVVTPSPVPRHQRICAQLLVFLGQHLLTHPTGTLYTGPMDVILGDGDVVAPDLVYVSSERAHIVGSKNLHGAPDLVVEVLSPVTKRRDVGIKRDLYERAGVREYWVVDPETQTLATHRRVDDRFGPPVFRSAASGAVCTSPLFPGLHLELTRLFG